MTSEIVTTQMQFEHNLGVTCYKCRDPTSERQELLFPAKKIHSNGTGRSKEGVQQGQLHLDCQKYLHKTFDLNLRMISVFHPLHQYL